MPSTPSSILIVRLSAIGDVVHALPMLDALRTAAPGARIGWIVEELAAPLLEGHPHLDRVYTLPRRKWRGRYRQAFRREILPYFSEVRRDGWDATLDLGGLMKSALVAWASGAGTRIGFAGENSREASGMLNNVRIFPRPSDVHVVQQNLRLLEGLGFSVPEIPPRGTMGLREEELIGARAMLEQAGWQGEPLVAVNAGGGFPSKLWPAIHYARLTELICRDHGYRPLILWGPREEPLRDELLQRLAPHRPIAAPPTSIRESVAVTACVSLFVGGDTGPSQIAGPLGVPAIVIFGSTTAARNHPWPGQDRTRVITVQRTDLPCIPCWERRCPLKGDAHMACLAGMGGDDVYTKIRPWLASRRHTVVG